MGVRGEVSATEIRRRWLMRVMLSLTCPSVCTRALVTSWGRRGARRPCCRRARPRRAQGAPGEAAGVPDRLRDAPHRPALPQRAGGQTVVAQQEGHVVAAVAGLREQSVGHHSEVGGVGRGGQSVQSVLDVDLGGLSETVRGQGEDRAALESQRDHREVRLGDDAQWWSTLRHGDLRCAVRVAQHGRMVCPARTHQAVPSSRSTST